jgi:hypothetical protein
LTPSPFAESGETPLAIAFEASPPIPRDGVYVFRVVSKAFGTDVGKPSEAIPFVTPSRTPSIISWLSDRMWVILGGSAGIYAALNLLCFAAARYSSAAWATKAAPQTFTMGAALAARSLRASAVGRGAIHGLIARVERRCRADSGRRSRDGTVSPNLPGADRERPNWRKKIPSGSNPWYLSLRLSWVETRHLRRIYLVGSPLLPLTADPQSNQHFRRLAR